MTISPNWTITDAGPWQLIYTDDAILSLSEACGTTSTQGTVFVGSKEECDAEVIRLGLPLAKDVLFEPQYQLVHDNQFILYFSVAATTEINGTSMLGTKQECESEIERLGLTWPLEDLEK